VIPTHVLQTVDEVAKDFPEIQGSQVLAFFAQMMRKFSKVRLGAQYYFLSLTFPATANDPGI
jgi:hypothetical protein